MKKRILFILIILFYYEACFAERNSESLTSEEEEILAGFLESDIDPCTMTLPNKELVWKFLKKNDPEFYKKWQVKNCKSKKID